MSERIGWDAMCSDNLPCHPLFSPRQRSATSLAGLIFRNFPELDPRTGCSYRSSVVLRITRNAWMHTSVGGHVLRHGSLMRSDNEFHRLYI